jgi:hypothetical protein
VRRLIVFAVVLILASLRVPAASGAERPSRWRTVWHISEALLVSANTADVATSWGKVEANPLLRSGQRFGAGALAIKMGMLAGGLTAQHFLVRKNPRQTAYFATANMAVSAALAAVAVHNMHVPR